MKNHWNQLLTVLFFILFLSAAGVYQRQNDVGYSNPAEISRDIAQVPCDNEKRLAAVKKLFAEAGATETNLRVEKYDNVENLVVIKPGRSPETIVFGAHYDKSKAGCGVIDNWSGNVILAHLYKTIHGQKTEKTYKFVAFGQEERGLIGSRAMVSAIPKNELRNYCAMVNFDSFGFSFPQAVQNISDESLSRVARRVSTDLKMPFASYELMADSDSTSFRKRQIPAITIHGLSNDYKKYLHTSKDRLDNINHDSVFTGYLFALNLLARLDRQPCAAHRRN